ncbi:unnamed protein product, partial [Menidia menidia]
SPGHSPGHGPGPGAGTSPGPGSLSVPDTAGPSEPSAACRGRSGAGTAQDTGRLRSPDPLSPAATAGSARMEMAQPLEVYLDLMSQPCRAVHILLACTGIPHRVRTVALRKGEQRAPAFTELNPMQKYLATRYDVPDHWYPRQPERRARVDEYTAWHHTNTRPHAAKVFQLEVLLPASSGAPPDGQRLQAALRQLDTTLGRLEAVFLRRQPFLCGHDVSLADLLALCELMQVRGGGRGQEGSWSGWGGLGAGACSASGGGGGLGVGACSLCPQPLGGGRDVLKDRPLLCSWRGRVQAATGQAFHAAHAVLLAVAERRRARL